MRRSLAILVLATAGVAGACESPQHELNQTADILALGESMSHMQVYIDNLEERIDSLNAVVARQDTTISRIATFAGIVLPDRR